MKQYILAIDQGTTGSTVLVIDRALSIRGRHTEEFAQIYPQPGWVEHDPEAILASVGRSVERALAAAGVQAEEIAAHRHHEPARDHAVLGPADRPGHPPRASCGRTAAPRTAARS
jgi:N-acetylglucosamine kinase-like BadF-type ATPase